MKIIDFSKILLISLALTSHAAKGSIIEISFAGELVSNYVTEAVYETSGGNYVPSGFENETSFHGALMYDDEAPIISSSSSIGNLYALSEIQLTIGDNYTLTSAGHVFIKNDFAGISDRMTFVFSDFTVDYLTPAEEMTYFESYLALDFYDDNMSIFDMDEKLPSAGEIEQFETYQLSQFSSISRADSYFIACPECIEGETEVYPRQELYIQGAINTAAVSTVPLPSSLILFASGLLGLFYRKFNTTDKNR